MTIHEAAARAIRRGLEQLERERPGSLPPWAVTEALASLRVYPAKK